jgi:hypothetical protein
MKHKKPTQKELMDSIRKPVPPPTRIERPVKGGGYKRKEKFHKNYE